MTTELQFLLDLLLSEKLSKQTQLKVKDRMREVEEAMRSAPFIMSAREPVHIPPPVRHVPINNQGQSESTRRILERNPDLAAKMSQEGGRTGVPPEVALQVSQQLHNIPTEPPVVNPAAIGQALATRQAMLNEAQMPMEQRAKVRRTALKTHGT